MSSKPASQPAPPVQSLDEMTPRQIVSELDKHVVGQRKAKRAVAIALRNRIRRRKLSPEMAEEVQPKNIIMIGTTGVGKTEIARRLARLANSPFIKVEASKFTEVGYVGRDVESIIRDLVDVAIDMIRQEKVVQIAEKAESNAEERLLDLLLPPLKKVDPEPQEAPAELPPQKASQELVVPDEARFLRTREKLRKKLRQGEMRDRIVEVDVPDRAFPSFEIITNQGVEDMDVNIRDMLPGLFGSRTRRRRLPVDEALDFLAMEEESKLVDMEQVTREAMERAEESGIVFLDEIDKIAGREAGQGPEVSREGVQRDILPILEGTTVNTRYGMVRTDHILFIAAGAFHVSRPSDLIPELQGRFPIRVELDSLTEEDFVRILREPRNALIKQYVELMATDGVRLRFTQSAISKIAHYAAAVNESSQDIGARRLHTIMEALMEDLSFNAPEIDQKSVTIDARFVRDQLADIVQDEDLSKYIL